jgi:predicted nucleotidyltransferase
MTIEDAAKLVAAWASEKPQIAKVHFYGSRVKETHREDSDLDVAIALIANLDESGGLATWMHYSDQWTVELNKAIPYEVQLEWDGGDGTPTIKNGLVEGSWLVHEKEV